LGNKAVSYGCAVLRRGGTLKLLHVIEANGATPAKNKPRPGKDNPKLRGKLRALVPAAAVEHFDIEEAVIQNGDAAKAIAQEAERFDADAICMGSHGRTGLAKTLLGSVAQGVMATTKRPVMVVRGDV
jgi:nucleotide-binding universal stress UspA family protein